jgi:hypothetical protein
METCCSGKCRQSVRGFISVGSEFWALPASPSVRMLSSSCGQKGGPCVLVGTSIQYAVTRECYCKSAIAFLTTLATSASGFVLSNMLMFSSFHATEMTDWLWHTCLIEGGANPCTFRMRVKTVKVAMLPNIYAR